jgi:hypothetical protein
VRRPIAPNTPIPIPVGPWVRGIVNTSAPHALTPDALLDARDCDINKDGHIAARPVYDLLSDDSPYSYLFELHGIYYAVANGSVGILGDNAFTAIHAVTGPVGWTAVNGLPVFCDYWGVYEIDGLTATQLVLRDIDKCEDRYGLVDMPGGMDVKYWQGRLLVLRGKSLLWSEAMDYGSHSAPRNFIRFRTTPTWMAPLPTGIFVGLQDSVVFLSGTDPGEFTQRTVAAASSEFSGIVADTRYMGMEGSVPAPVAVWFSDVGFVVGSGDGSVSYPQRGNIKGLPLVPRRISIVGERAIAFAIEE